MKHVGLLLGCLILIASSVLQAMAQSRVVVPQMVAEPIKVTTLPVKTSWNRQPILQVENISTKPIEYLTIEAKLPGATDPFMLAYGHAPGKPADRNVKPLQPGAKIRLSLDRHGCELTKKSLLEKGVRSLTGKHVTARINGVVFNDQTAWFDGLPHVMEPNNPLRWTVVRSTATASTDSPFGFLKVGFRENSNATPRPAMCWDRVGTEWVDCCGFQQASAILVQVWGGIWEPFPMSSECCEWIKQVGCSEPPW